MRRSQIGAVLALLAISVGVAFITWSVLSRGAPDTSRPTTQAAATYVGSSACADCHERQYELWTGSDHDLAMQVASEESVLGDFDDATFTNYGVTSTFYRRDGDFFVRTDGPDGTLQDYEIAYTFGFYPLQQYLIEFPRGRYQTLGIGWDSRPEAEGGQRWFHLYPDERIPYDDELHWTGLNQTWNFMCAECHSTDLQKNYDLASDTYRTTWAEIDVACEACHGPGSGHVVWAESPDRETESYGADLKGLVFQLGGRTGWVLEPGTTTATRTEPLSGNSQIDTCARCHSLRVVLSSEYVHGRSLLDTHLPRLLDEDIYFADGQILGEVYVYGSFLQSTMYRAGVVCSDCHDPHSLSVRASGNALCARCHQPATFDTRSHHNHEPGGEGASCANCHMPARTYMVVDPRRDHSMRVPRPDLSLSIGSPNACTGCHSDRSAEWAAETVARWSGPSLRARPQYGEALYAGRTGAPGAADSLIQLARDETRPNIARASALSLLQWLLTPSALEPIRDALADDDPILRTAALEALANADPDTRLRYAYPLLNDTVRAVRVQAARVLASVPPDVMTSRQLEPLDRAIDEYIESQLANADRSAAHLNIGALLAARGWLAEAESAYRTALRLDSSFVQAYVNLADLYRLQGRDDEGERVLREALEVAPEVAVIHHALGLLLVRRRRMPEALDELERAARLQPEEPRYGYVYGVALNEVGEPAEAIAVLERALELSPYDRDILIALANFNRDSGAIDRAIQYVERLLELAPEDPGARAFLERLEAGRGE